MAVAVLPSPPSGGHYVFYDYQTITPVKTRRIGYDPDPHGEIPPSADERFAALADAVEATADSSTPAAKKKAVLDHLRELRERLGRVAAGPGR